MANPSQSSRCTAQTEGKSVDSVNTPGMPTLWTREIRISAGRAAYFLAGLAVMYSRSPGMAKSTIP